MLRRLDSSLHVRLLILLGFRCSEAGGLNLMPNIYIQKTTHLCELFFLFPTTFARLLAFHTGFLGFPYPPGTDHLFPDGR